MDYYEIPMIDELGTCYRGSILQDSIENKEKPLDTLPTVIYDKYNDSYFVEFAPIIINDHDYAYVESINSFMHMDHDKNALCDTYIMVMMLLKFIMREENMVVGIFMLPNHLSLC